MYLQQQQTSRQEKIWTQGEKSRGIWIATDVTFQTSQPAQVSGGEVGITMENQKICETRHRHSARKEYGLKKKECKKKVKKKHKEVKQSSKKGIIKRRKGRKERLSQRDNELQKGGRSRGIVQLGLKWSKQRPPTPLAL